MIAARTDVGRVRDHNEDNFIVCPDLEQQKWQFENNRIVSPGEPGTLLVVADGMGGMNAGEVASRIAVDAIKSVFGEKIKPGFVPDDNLIESTLKASVKLANKEILREQQRDPETEGMGTTVVIAWITGGRLYCAWCGDSRCYIYNPDFSSDSERAGRFAESRHHVTGNLAQVTKDHSEVQELVDRGILTVEQAFYHPNSNIITRSLGSDEGGATPELFSCGIMTGDRILLCSDGLCGLLTDEQLCDLVQAEPDPGECVRSLVDAANDAGGTDNITVVIADVKEVGSFANVTVSEKRRKRFFPGILLAAVVLLLAGYLILRDKDNGFLVLVSPSAFVDANGDTITIPASDSLSLTPAGQFNREMIACDSTEVRDERDSVAILDKGDTVYFRAQKE